MERIITSLIITLISGWLGVTMAMVLSGEKISIMFPLIVFLMVGGVALFYYYRKRRS